MKKVMTLSTENHGLPVSCDHTDFPGGFILLVLNILQFPDMMDFEVPAGFSAVLALLRVHAFN